MRTPEKLSNLRLVASAEGNWGSGEVEGLLDTADVERAMQRVIQIRLLCFEMKRPVGAGAIERQRQADGDLSMLWVAHTSTSLNFAVRAPFFDGGHKPRSLLFRHISH